MTASFNMGEFTAKLESAAERLNARLCALLKQETTSEFQSRVPDRLGAAMAHALLAGGKRFRPFVLRAAWALFEDSQGDPDWAGAAVECLHTYSLVHDDLPAMDDDDLRRGRPTVHKAFDEATAILAGDTLLTLAFHELARPRVHPDPSVRIDLVAILAGASGVRGMAGGQMMDMDAGDHPLDFAGIGTMQAMKTGALLAASCEMGAALARAGSPQREILREYGLRLGRVFQIADDILDCEATSESLGKTAAKDAGQGKATFVSLLGMDRAKALLADSVLECTATLATFGDRAEELIAAAHFAAQRRN